MISKREILLTQLGFRFGKNGPHAARTMMLGDIATLFEHLPEEATRTDYAHAVKDLNVLGKPTKSARTLAFRHLCDLYGLSPDLVLFRAFRRFWSISPESRPILALSMALARDPLLRATLSPMLAKKPGDVVHREEVEEILVSSFPDRFSVASLHSFAQNIGGSWTQAGYLQGKMRKTRCQPAIEPAAVAFCLFLGFLEGLSGQRVFATGWMKLLDRPIDTLEALTVTASQRGWLRYLRAGDVKELSFPQFLTKEDERIRQGVIHVL